MTGVMAMKAEHETLLHAYHDGELSPLARWRFERTLRKSPELRRELAALRALQGGLRTLDADAEEPDLWRGVAQGLPAADERPAEARGEAQGHSLVWWLTPIGAAAAATALVWAVVYGGFWTHTRAAGGVVRWIDSGGRSVLVLDDDPDTTIIWVLDSATEGAARGGPRDVV